MTKLKNKSAVKQTSISTFRKRQQASNVVSNKVAELCDNRSTMKNLPSYGIQDGIIFPPHLWAKIKYFRDKSDTEVGCFAETHPDDPMMVVDLHFTKQEVSSASVDFDDDGIADYTFDMASKGLSPENFMRIWIHTHPSKSASPSNTDWDTFDETFGQCPWAVMFILGTDDTFTCTMRVGDTSDNLEVMVGVLPHPEWDKEYDDNVTECTYASGYGAYGDYGYGRSTGATQYWDTETKKWLRYEDKASKKTDRQQEFQKLYTKLTDAQNYKQAKDASVDIDHVFEYGVGSFFADLQVAYDLCEPNQTNMVIAFWAECEELFGIDSTLGSATVALSPTQFVLSHRDMGISTEADLDAAHKKAGAKFDRDLIMIARYGHGDEAGYGPCIKDGHGPSIANLFFSDDPVDYQIAVADIYALKDAECERIIKQIDRQSIEMYRTLLNTDEEYDQWLKLHETNAISDTQESSILPI